MPVRTARRALTAAIALAAGAAFAAPATVQSDYPSRPVRVLVGSPAGGATDITARILAETMAPAFPRGIVVENRTGAGGSIAAEVVARAAADGYTLLMNDAQMLAINPVLYGRVTYDPLKDFAPVGMVAEFPFVIVVHASIPVQTLKEFADWAKAQPDPILYGTPSAGSQHHLGMEQLAQRLGIRVTNVPYRGGAPATMDLIAGQIKVGSIGLPPLVPHIRAGTVRPLAVSTGRRSPQIPNVPTISEAGVPGLELAVWYGVAAPAGTPEPVLRVLEAEVGKAVASPGVVTKLGENGLFARWMDRTTFTRFIEAEVESWGTAARASGVRLN